MGDTRVADAFDALHPALPGHFPGNPIVPGVVLLDHVCRVLAQEHGVAVKALPAVKFHAPLRPAESFTTELAPAGTGRFRFRVMRGDTLIAAGTIETGPACARPKAD